MRGCPKGILVNTIGKSLAARVDRESPPVSIDFKFPEGTGSGHLNTTQIAWWLPGRSTHSSCLSAERRLCQFPWSTVRFIETTVASMRNHQPLTSSGEMLAGRALEPLTHERGFL
jgi:hypothetical protein